MNINRLTQKVFVTKLYPYEHFYYKVARLKSVLLMPAMKSHSIFLRRSSIDLHHTCCTSVSHDLQTHNEQIMRPP